MDMINSVMKQLELTIRGKRVDDKELWQQSHSLFEWAMKQFRDKESLAMDKANREHFIEAAILLHNKCKAVGVTTLSHLAEAVSFIKGAASWLLSTYGYSNTKFEVMFIRLHCRVASEMITLGQTTHALHSLYEVVRYWDKLNEQALEMVLPPLELEGLRYVIFTAVLDFSKLLRSQGDDDMEGVRKCVGKALEVLPYLPSVRLYFNEHVLELGQELAAQGSYQEAIHYLRMAHSSLHMIASNGYPPLGTNECGDNGEERVSGKMSLDEVHMLSCRALLSLAYVYQETSQYEKALTCVKEAEVLNDTLGQASNTTSSSCVSGHAAVSSSTVSFSTSSSSAQMQAGQSEGPVVCISRETFTFARFSINCRTGDVDGAAGALRRLIAETSSFDMALNGIVMFLQGTGVICLGDENGESGTDRTVPVAPSTALLYLDLFQLLGRKFNRDPEFSCTRVAHLQYTLTAVQLLQSASASSQQQPAISMGPCAEEEGSDALSAALRRAADISRAIVMDHTQGLHVLDRDSMDKFYRLLQERMKFCRLKGCWEEAVEWCDMLLSFLEPVDISTKVSLLTWKSDACVHCNRKEDALKLALAAVQLARSTRTLLTAFHVALQSRSAAEAVDIFLRLQRGEPVSVEGDQVGGDADMGEVKRIRDEQGDNALSSAGDDLERLISACKVAKEASLLENSNSAAEASVPWCGVDGESTYNHSCEEAVNLLLREWVREYIAGRIWRNLLSLPPTGAADADDSMECGLPSDRLLSDDFLPHHFSSAPSTGNPTLLEVLCELCQLFLRLHLRTVPLQAEETLPPVDLCGVEARGGCDDMVGVGVPMQEEGEGDVHPEPLDVLADGDGHDEDSSVARDPSVETVPQSAVESSSPLEGPGGQQGDDTGVDIDNQATGRESVVFQEDGKCRYELHCNSVAETIGQLLSLMESFVQLFSTVDAGVAAETDLSPLGVPEDIYWMGDVLWNMGVLLMNRDKCKVIKSVPEVTHTDTKHDEGPEGSWSQYDGESGPLALREAYERSEASARCLEMAQQLYCSAALFQRRQQQHFLDAETGAVAESARKGVQERDEGAEEGKVCSNPSANSARNQLVSLLMSLSLRLDVDSLLREVTRMGRASQMRQTERVPAGVPETSSKQPQDWNPDTEALLSVNLQALRAAETKADGLMRELMGIGAAPSALRRVFLILSLAIRCRIASVDVDAFVDLHQQEFVSLSVEELQRCADIARAGGPVCVGVCRRMLQYGVQVLMRKSTPDYALVGSLYRRLVYLSPSRMQALLWIEELEQLIRTLKTRTHTSTAATSAIASRTEQKETTLAEEPGPELPFCAEDIDALCTLCYNWGVTLVELNQHDLAEKFACKALSLTAYASPHVTSLKETIQDAYLYILKAKTDNRREDARTRATFFGLHSGSSGTASGLSSNVSAASAVVSSSLQPVPCPKIPADLATSCSVESAAPS